MKSLKKLLYLALTTLLLTSSLVTVMAANTTTMYAPDGRSIEVSSNDVAAWQNVGWYSYPVMNVYAPDGRCVVIAKVGLQAWENTGWYSYPVMNMYAPDGRCIVIDKSTCQTWQNVGWYSYPVITVYAPDGRSIIIAQSDLQSWENVGWHAKSTNISYVPTTTNTPATNMYYPNTSIPDYTYVTGVPLKTVHSGDTAYIYIYEYTDFGEYPEAVDYMGYLEKLGWSEYKEVDEPTNITYYFSKGPGLVGISYYPKYDEVWVIFSK